MIIKISQEVDSIVESVMRGDRISTIQALSLWNNAPLSLLGYLATDVKRRKSGDEVYYNRNFHIEPTNICLFNCKFCSYRRPAGSPEAWDYTTAQIEEIASKYADSAVTEVHIVGGVHPNHDLYHYIDMIRRVKDILPSAVIKAFTAIELAYMIEKSGIELKRALTMLKEAGMEAIPGGGAEIFDEQLRAQICPDKGSSKQWLELHQAAHEVGISTNATILYGHIETIDHRIDHLDRLRKLQDTSKGFNAFIPLKYRNYGNSMSDIGEVSIVEDMKMLALSRIFLDNIPHIKAYWVMYGKETTELALAFGADDIDGTIDNSTKIYSMAGAQDTNPKMTVAEIKELVQRAGYKAVERDTFYNKITKK